MPSSRPDPSAAGSLARHGFVDTEAAVAHLERLDGAVDSLVTLLSRTADPDLALATLVGLAEALDASEDEALSRQDLLDTLVGDDGTARRLLAVLGASRALGQHLVRHPGQWRELADDTLRSTRPAAYAVRAALLASVGADPEDDQPVATLVDGEACDALRVEYRRRLLRLAARDLVHHLRVDDAAAELAELAEGTLEAALAVARTRVGEQADTCRLAVVAMGKCGGHELNYVSDVDVVFVAEPADGAEEAAALRVGTQLASHLIRICSDQTAEGTIWPVDAALRPEGKSGPLVRTLESHHSYYQRWAKTWEFQALLKARPVAGDAALGREYVGLMKPLVWEASAREGFVEDVQAMRRRVVANIPAGQADRQLKLGPGGLRDVEFAVQLLQMVHGRADETVRPPATLSALARLIEGGYVGIDDGRRMHEAYAFLRTMEHRIQLFDLRRTHVVPDEEAALRRLGRSLGLLKDPVGELDEQWRYHRREVRRLHQKLFYRPLLSAVARTSDGGRLTPEAARDRLSALGYADPRAALKHLEALTGGVSRTASIQRTLLPVMLEWFADAPDPDAGLLGFRQISEALGQTPWYLRLLRDEGQAAQYLATVLATSRYATGLMKREPEGVQLLGSDQRLAPLSREVVQREMLAAASRREDRTEAVLAVRGVRRGELLRVSAADLCVPFGVAEVGYALTDVMSATLEATLQAVVASYEREQGTLPTRMAIVAMGRYGGHELGYGSDADVMFVHDPLPDVETERAANAAQWVAGELRRLLAAPSTDPALDVDAGLRPEGKQGPMVRSLESYRAYYAKWSAVWEAQALLRAEATVGDADLCRRFTEMIDPLRFPEGGLSEEDSREVRRIKARVDNERLPRGADPATHFKLGRGGLADIEWTVQALQLDHAHDVPGLRTTRTLEAISAAAEAELLSVADAESLREAWLLASRLRNATVQVRGRPSDSLPHSHTERAAVAAVLKYAPGETDTMVNDYLRTSRRARAVVDRVFWA